MTWLKHPLVVALATALFAGVGANFVVRTWQNHDKQLTCSACELSVSSS